jgi:transforming growth factor-beta-induced protein
MPEERSLSAKRRMPKSSRGGASNQPHECVVAHRHSRNLIGKGNEALQIRKGSPPMKTRQLSSSFAALVATFGLAISFASPSAFAQTSTTTTTTPLPTSTINLIDQLKNAKSLATLSAAIDAAGLTETLRNGGPFTVFAPDDAAFDLLPSGTLAELLKPQNKTRLAAILGVHVVPGRYSAGDLQRSTTRLKSIGGQDLTIGRVNGRITVNGAGVRQSDLVASNTVIHIIDTVLTVPAVIGQSNAFDQAKANETLKTFVAAVEAAGLTSALQVPGPITLFVPDDVAFDLLGKDVTKNLLKPENKAALTTLLQGHVVTGRYTAADIAKLKPAELKTLGGTTLSFNLRNSRTTVNKAGIVKADIPITNGVIHIIDTVL